MPARTVKWMLLGFVGMVVMGFGMGTASASHYRIEELGVFSEEQVESLLSTGVSTTRDFLERAQLPEERQQLSEQTGIAELEILVFARLCDLLQIIGVGPRAAQLLRAAGVLSAQDLATRDPAALVETLAAVNAVQSLTGIDPTTENLVTWIEEAAGATFHVQ